MNVAISYCEHDEELAHRWFAWCAELGGCENHDLVVLPFKGLTAPAIKDWKSVTVLRDYSGVRSDWSEPGAIRDASGPNFAFRELANHFHAKKSGPWFYVEPDAIPLRKDWIDLIEAEYANAGHRYMGARVQVPETPVHMSGIGVYPEDLAVTGPNFMQPRLAQFGERWVEAAFNLAGAPDALADFHETPLIQQVFRGPVIQALDEVRPDAAIFHNDKSGKLIYLLQHRGESDSIGSHKPDSAGSTPAPAIIALSPSGNGTPFGTEHTEGSSPSNATLSHKCRPSLQDVIECERQEFGAFTELLARELERRRKSA